MSERLAARLAAMRARVEAAGPGPWRIVGADSWHLEGFPQVELNDERGSYFPVNNDRIAEFVAHARADVPLLLAVAEAAAQVCRSLDDGNTVLHLGTILQDVQVLRAALDALAEASR